MKGKREKRKGYLNGKKGKKKDIWKGKKEDIWKGKKRKKKNNL